MRGFGGWVCDSLLSNYAPSLRSIPDPSISATEAVITSCVIAVISAVVSSGLRMGVKKFKDFDTNQARVFPTYEMDDIGNIDVENQAPVNPETHEMAADRYVSRDSSQIVPVENEYLEKDVDDIILDEVPNALPRSKPKGTSKVKNQTTESDKETIFKFTR